MDRNKLLQIIQTNLDELSEINLEMKGSSKLSKFEVDLALSKAKMILQEYEILREIHDQDDEPVTPTSKVQITEVIAEEAPKAETPSVSKEAPAVEDYKEKKQEAPIIVTVEDLPIQEEEEEEEEEQVAVSIPRPEPLIQEEKVVKVIETVIPEPAVQEAHTSGTNGSSKKTLTDQFQSKSLNDLLTATNKLDQRFASSPISKLEAAIGLNDRFQYIRELFSNDADLFRDTIGKLDRMHTLEEAVEHLDSKFNWEKDDTSLQFLHLVKRRFSN